MGIHGTTVCTELGGGDGSGDAPLSTVIEAESILK
jgi:hypothetical protein